MEPVSLLMQLLSGAVGGAFAAALFRLQLGSVGTAVAGLVGGGLGVNATNALLNLTPVQASQAVAGLDPAMLVSHAAGGGIGGIVMTLIVAALQKAAAPDRR